MSVVDEKAFNEFGDGEPDDADSARVDDRAAHQAAWFGINDGESTQGAGPYVGVVFNRPIEQVFTYRVPNRLSRIIQAGQRVRGTLGPRRPSGGRLLRLGRPATAWRTSSRRESKRWSRCSTPSP